MTKRDHKDPIKEEQEAAAMWQDGVVGKRGKDRERERENSKQEPTQ